MRHGKQLIRLFWRFDLGPGLENRVLEIERLPAINRREARTVDNHVAAADDAVVCVLFGSRHPEGFINRQERTLNLLNGSGNMSKKCARSPTAGRDLFFYDCGLPREF